MSIAILTLKEQQEIDIAQSILSEAENQRSLHKYKWKNPETFQSWISPITSSTVQRYQPLLPSNISIDESVSIRAFDAIYKNYDQYFQDKGQHITSTLEIDGTKWVILTTSSLHFRLQTSPNYLPKEVIIQSNSRHLTKNIYFRKKSIFI